MALPKGKKEIVVLMERGLYDKFKAYRLVVRKTSADIINELLTDFLEKETIRLRKLKEKEEARLLKIQEKTQKNSLSS